MVQRRPDNTLVYMLMTVSPCGRTACEMFPMCLLVLLSGLLFASARVIPGHGGIVDYHALVKHCPQARQCCRYPVSTQDFQECCDNIGCCTECDDVYHYEGHGDYEIRQDCVGSYECCLFPFLSDEFNKCCFEHGCCPLCGFLSDGCCYNNVFYPWGSLIASFPECCLDFVCAARLIDSPPYLKAVIVHRHSVPTGFDHQCKHIQNDFCVDQRNIFHMDGEEWLADPCTLCSCHNGHISCRHVRPQCPPAPHSLCREVPGNCCPSWDCDTTLRGNCPDPNSFGGVCGGALCQTDSDCQSGQLCCLVTGCGRRCINAKTGRCNLNTITCHRQGGRCREICDRIEEPLLHLCSTSDCFCCVPGLCKTSQVCQAQNGRCSKICDRGDIQVDAACETRDCICCIPETDHCKVDTLLCRHKGGHCDKECDSYEEPVEHLCNTDNCLCCVPKSDKCHVNTPRCHSQGGQCKEECDGGENPIGNLCNVDNCLCCVPKHQQCQNATVCQLLHGHCSSKCVGGEIPVNGLCETGCICCLPGFNPCKFNTPYCLIKGGHCDVTCDSHEDFVKNLCISDNCVCCVPKPDSCKHDTPYCLSRGGHCDIVCGEDEDAISHLCNMNECFCCVPRHDPCKHDTQYCLNRGGHCDLSCGKDEDSISHLCITDECLCCVKRNCSNANRCDALNGYCSKDCTIGENSVGGICEPGCFCCVPEHDPCKHDTPYCLRRGGHCEHSCGKDEDAISHQCNSDNCFCCVPRYCSNVSRCDALNGYCSKDCAIVENPVGGICEPGCFCCVPEHDPCKHDTPYCLGQGGHCDLSCGRDEDAINHLCNTDKCFCCVPRHDPCNHDTHYCLDRGGHCDISCGKDEDSINPLCITDECLCCVKRNFSNVTRCDSLKGYCSKDCGIGENPVTEHNPCKHDTPYCLSRGGHCDLSCDKDEDGIGHLCNTEECLCCVQRHDPCKHDTHYCLNRGGHCELSCGKDEDAIGYCSNVTGCDSLNGYCSKDCGIGENSVDNVCEPGCFCCIPEPYQCKHDAPYCLDRGGHCDLSCDKNEDAISHLCNSDECFCCVSKHDPCKEDSPYCLSRGGHCELSCGKDEDAIGHLCNTDECSCCVKRECSNASRCNALNGYCSSHCSIGENPVAGLCEPGCFCCVLEQDPCKHDTPFCLNHGGHCKLSCDHNEEAINNLCNTNECYCCVPNIIHHN